MTVIEFELNLLPSLQNQLNTMHWAKRMREKKLIVGHLLAHIPQGSRKLKAQKAKITLTRFSCKEPDYDGLVGSWKSIIDSLVKLGVLEDDSPKVIGYPTYLWEKTKRGAGKIKVRIEFAKN